MKTIGWVSFVVVLFFVIVLYRTSSGNADVHTAGGSKQDGVDSHLVDGAIIEGGTTRNREIVANSPGPGSLSIVVVDDQFSVGIPAWILADERLIGKLDGDGAPWVGDEKVMGSAGGTITITSRAHAPQVLSLESAFATGELEVRMKSAGTASVTIVDQDGRPVIGVPIELSHSRNAQRLPIGMTGQVGKLAFGLGVPCQANMTVGGIEQVISIRPGEDRMIVVPSEQMIVQFVDDETGQPRGGFEVEIKPSDGGAGAVRRVLIDETGQLVIGRHKGGVHLFVDSSLIGRLKSMPGSEAYVATRDGNYAVISSLDSPDVLRVGCEWNEVNFLLVDDRTGANLDGVAELYIQFVHTGSDRAQVVLKGRVPLENGLLTVPSGWLPKREFERLQIGVPRFKTLVLGQDKLRASATPGSETLRLPMTNVGERERFVRVMFRGGEPFVGDVLIYTADQQSLLFRGTDVGGVYGPFVWPGGDVALSYYGTTFGSASPVAEGLGMNIRGDQWSPLEVQRNHVLGIVGGADVRSGDGTLVIDAIKPAGEIEIGGLPLEPVDVYAANGYGELFSASYQEGRLAIKGLPAGLYIVGPRVWVENMRDQVFCEEGLSLLTVVQSGQVTGMKWDPRWKSEDEISGRIHCGVDGFEQQVYLKPIYGVVGLKPSTVLIGNRNRFLQGDSDSARRGIKVSKGGGYVIPRGDPVPEALAVVAYNRVRESQWLQVLSPGADANLNVRGVRLNRGSAFQEATGSVLVVFRLDCLEYDYPVQSLPDRAQAWYLQWTPQAQKELYLGLVPNCVESITVRSEGQTVGTRYGISGPIDSEGIQTSML